jgi:hypothetical protein
MNISHLLDVAEQALAADDLALCAAAHQSLKQALQFHGPPVAQVRLAKRLIDRLSVRLKA